MNNITLVNSTKVPKIDLLLCQIINLLEQMTESSCVDCAIALYALKITFKEHYKAYLLTELQHTDDAYKLYTVKRLGQIIYSDRAVVVALEKMKNTNNQELKLQIDATLQHYQAR